MCERQLAGEQAAVSSRKAPNTSTSYGSNHDSARAAATA